MTWNQPDWKIQTLFWIRDGLTYIIWLYFLDETIRQTNFKPKYGLDLKCLIQSRFDSSIPSTHSHMIETDTRNSQPAAFFQSSSFRHSYASMGSDGRN